MDNLIEPVNHVLRSIGLSQSMSDDLDQVIIILLIMGIAYLANYVVRLVVVNTVGKIVKHTKATWDDELFNRKVLTNFIRIVAPILIYIFIPLAFAKDSEWLDFLRRVCMIYIIAVMLRFLSSLISSIFNIYNKKEQFKDRPLKGLMQTFQVLLFFMGGIIIISILINKSPATLFAGLGASAAILMLVFKDSIMGFVSGIQLSANNMLRAGDWITVPAYGADGTVLEVTLNTVKIRNWDNTITTLPPYALISGSFVNWRGMEESGGRRIMRSINIDMNSVRFCTKEMLDKYKKISLLADYIERTQQEFEKYNEEQSIDASVVVNGRRQTNLGVFRAYLTAYLKNLPAANKDMTLMVRYLQPTEQGIPVQLYFFSAIKSWIPYEGVQADVFDHILAIVPEFDLQVFQNPSGSDVRQLVRAFKS